MNPQLGMSTIALQQYEKIAMNFILPRCAFHWWDIQNDQKYKDWPEIIKHDKFIENCWKENFEDDAKAKVIYEMMYF